METKNTEIKEWLGIPTIWTQHILDKQGSDNMLENIAAKSLSCWDTYTYQAHINRFHYELTSPALVKNR